MSVASVTKQLSIEDLIQNTEQQHSLFEDALIALPLNSVDVFKSNPRAVGFQSSSDLSTSKVQADVQEAFPFLSSQCDGRILEAVPSPVEIKGKRVAALFSGGPAAGGHNVLVGIREALGAENLLFGVKSGPKGLLAGDLFEIGVDDLQRVRNLGGFDFLGSDRTKIKTPAQFEQVKKVVLDNRLDGIIVIGGDDSNTNAAVLAEYLKDVNCTVVGVPKTIDGDLQIGTLLPASFGFDTATRIYSEMVGNILQDTPSSRKYWHFIKLMGRSASQVALEVALQTKPALTLISEEVAAEKMSLATVINQIASIVAYRAAKGIDYGVLLIPEGLIEFIVEFQALIAELNDLIAAHESEFSDMDVQKKVALIESKLSLEGSTLLSSLPDKIRQMLLLDRDSHGNLQVSQIPTESLLVEMAGIRIEELKRNPSQIADFSELSSEEVARFQSSKFSALTHFFGYEGRCGAPTLFDATYTYNLGLTAGALVLHQKTGYMSSVTELDRGGRAIAIPLVGLLNAERRHGKNEMVIKKALVELDGNAFLYFKKRRRSWAQSDRFCSPGPRQYWGPVSTQLPMSVALNQGYASLSFVIGN